MKGKKSEILGLTNRKDEALEIFDWRTKRGRKLVKKCDDYVWVGPGGVEWCEVRVGCCCSRPTRWLCCERKKNVVRLGDFSSMVPLFNVC